MYDQKTMIPFIDLKTQYETLKPHIFERISRVFEHGQYIMGPEILELEQKLADFVGVEHCITASSGTDTLLIAMMALGIGPGDEVITTPFTFISTAEMIALTGAKPVFVDIDPFTYNIDPIKIKDKITSKTKAIIPVSLYGQCADMDGINAIATKHNLPVIEDAAQSFGASYRGKKSCSLTTIGSTSFFPSKPLGCYGDGGALFTNDRQLAKKMREIRVHGQDRRYHHVSVGINGRLDTIQAAILLVKLGQFPWELEKRIEIGARYTSLLSELSDRLTCPFLEINNISVYAQYTVRVKQRDNFISELNKRNIPTSIHYPVPLFLQPAFSKYVNAEESFFQSEAAALEVVSLPMGPYLSAEHQDFIVNTIKEIL